MISIVCYLFNGNRDFLAGYVDALALQAKTHLTEPHRFVCVTDRPAREFGPDVEVVAMPEVCRALAKLPAPAGRNFPSSYPRLWTLSREARILGERVLLLDIDAMIVRPMAPLFIPQAEFVGWRVKSGPGQPPRFAGGTWLHTTGTRTWVWDQFIDNPARAIEDAKALGYPGSDQAWISMCLSEREAQWPEPSGIYRAQEYRKSWDRSRRLALKRQARRPARRWPVEPLVVPRDAIILHMNGVEKPWRSRDDICRDHFWPFMKRADARRREREAAAC